MKTKEMEYYLHIPFCVKKCDYCDFLSFPAKKDLQKQYKEALIREISDWKTDDEESVRSVFIGGGTPSLLEGEEIREILDALYAALRVTPEILHRQNAEITIECNPGTLDREKLKAYKEAGINRISLGLQSACNEELKCLGRIHTWEKFLESYQLVRKSGFDNVNVDLMSALPGQSIGSWKDTLYKVTALKPEHISAYSLIVEEGTPFFERYGTEEQIREMGGTCHFLPSEETERSMYRLTKELLEEAGYHRYEISNYAREGYSCRHNLGYWKRIPYKGFGLGAASLIREQRLKNTEDLAAYLRGQRQEEMPELLTKENQMEETMFLGLRMDEGVSKAGFQEKFGKTIEEVYGKVLEKYQKLGMLEVTDHDVFLTEDGRDVSNYLLSDFLFE